MIFRNNQDYFSKRLVYFKGGGSDSVDEVYNAGMLDLSEHQQGMADELFSYYKHGTGGSWEETQVETSAATTGSRQVLVNGNGRDGNAIYQTETYAIPAEYETQRTWVPDGSTNGYLDMEQMQVDANMELIPYQTEEARRTAMAGTDAAKLAGQQARSDRRLLPNQENLSAEQTAAARELLPGQTALAAKTMADTSAMIDERAPVRQAFYNEARNGVNAEDRANKAAADAAHSFMNSNSTSRRESARMGVNPNSGRFKAMQTSNDMSRAKAIGGASTQARTQAENDNFGRLETAMNYGGS